MPSEADKFDTLEKIGHGSFGVIRKVRRKKDGFIMCRKEISYVRMSQKEREQLHAEFHILSTLRHPNIVAYYEREHLKSSQDLHLYMEYCGNGDLGRTIKDLIGKQEYAGETFVWSIFTQLVSALYRCHYGVDPPDVGANVLGLCKEVKRPVVDPKTMTILHRDLKPENVFLGANNSVKLGDFGLSKVIGPHDFASTYVGTPFYMSPEICAAEKYTLKSDIWSLGCIMYELCALEPPFNAKSHFQLVQKIKEGKVAPLPSEYSPELMQVIRDCLKVNPDRRPDTAQLLNIPVIRLMRKEKEVTELYDTLREREKALIKREKEVAARTSSLDSDREKIRQEIDASLRREWEVKARLEIDKHVNLEMEQLQDRFESEVQARVDAELSKKTVLFAPPQAELSSSKSDYPNSLLSQSGDDFPSTTDLSELSLDSPNTSNPALKKSTRTPFGRAQTMFAGHANTPMDVEMASPSPIAIASLSLSPRRNAGAKAPNTHTGNIFAAASAKEGKGEGVKWDIPEEPSSSEDEELDVVPSPTRNPKSMKNPFTSKTRPILQSQKSAPINRKTAAAANANKTLPSLPTAQPEAPRGRERPHSPNRRLSKIPSAANLGSAKENAGEGPTLSRKPSTSKKDAHAAPEPKAAPPSAKNIRGRTLVELQQARAGGRPLSAVAVATTAAAGENTSPKRAVRSVPTVVCEKRSSAGDIGPAPVWDPERDDMPSPFLIKTRPMARA